MMTCARPGRPCSRRARSDPQAGVARCAVRPAGQCQ
jgi:hypothetical protein